MDGNSPEDRAAIVACGDGQPGNRTPGLSVDKAGRLRASKRWSAGTARFEFDHQARDRFWPWMDW
jgi:hypothetical protein